MPAHRIKVALVGPLRVSANDGIDLTPPSKKSKGLIAILCTSPNLRCSRTKLQDKLWSDRPHEQGSNSLRQALTLIRKHLGEYRDILLADDDWIGLDESVVQVELEPRAIYPQHMMPEFAEGLQINDAEFEDWIRQQRSHYGKVWEEISSRNKRDSHYPYSKGDDGLRNGPTVLVIAALPLDDPELKFLVDVTLRDAARRACSFGDFAIVEESEDLEIDEGALKITCLISRIGERAILQPVLLVAKSLRTIWSQTFQCNVSQLLDISDDISDALTLAILKSGTAILKNEALNADLPLSDIFGYSQTGLYSADKLLEKADAERDVPAYLSLRAYVRHTMIMERVTDQRDLALAEADEMVGKALERAPFDPFTLSVRSLISGLKDQNELALDYAQRAVQGDNRNAFARQSLSVALSFAGYESAANQEAMAARSSRMVVISPAIYYLRCSYAALGVGKEAEALSYAKMAHGTAPNFRPALRVMAALYFRQKDEAMAVKYLEMLRDVEPDFSLDLMADSSYPVDSLRKANALDVVKSRLI